MNTTLISDVIVGERQRKAIDKASLGELKQSITSKVGLLNPPVMSIIDGKPHLVAGERRFRAIEELAKDGIKITHNGQEIALGLIPYTTLSDPSEMTRFLAELDENIMRVDLSWQDKNNALAALHRMRTGINPSQKQVDTAKEIVAKVPTGPDLPPPPKVESVRQAISKATIISENLHRPEIAKARNETEAYNLITKGQEEHFLAELYRRQKAKNPIATIRCEVRCGDSVELLSQLEPATVDLILSDPPYGVFADSAPGFRARSVLHHNYEDTPEYARRVMKAILMDGFRVTKPQANLFLFTDIKHFSWLLETGAMMGWKCWRYPIIWQKSQSEGLTPWQRRGPVHTFDVIFYATKGFRGLHERMLDILTVPRVKRNEKLYAAEKPLPLLSTLIGAGSLPGDLVLDPCCGSGSTLVAAKALHRPSLGIELDPAVCDLATTRISSGDAGIDWSVLGPEVSNDLDPEFFPSAPPPGV